MKVQALVVGAGPVGLTMAAELARYGVSVRIVDQAAERTDKSKALVLWSRTLELLDRSGIGERFVAAGQKVRAANIIAGQQPIGRILFEGVDTPYPFALMLAQSGTERLLEEHLASRGIAVERRVELASFVDHGDGVSCVLRRADGRAETVLADWLIGCDGAHSTVRHALGLTFAGSTMTSDWALADVHLKGYPFPESELSTYWHKDGVLAIFPITPGRFRVIADVGSSQRDGAPPTPTIESVQALMDQRGPGGIEAVDPIWLSAFRINERKVAEYRVGRVFLAGDAAHVHSPAGGQGMNTGMQDAFNLSWKLAMVCRGTGAEKLLDSYNVERSAVGDQVLKAAGMLTEVATLRNPVGRGVRNAVGHFLLGLASVRRRMTDTMTEVSIGYKDSPLNGPAGHGFEPGPGERVRPIAGELPAGSGAVPRFSLHAEAGPLADGLVARFSATLDAALHPPIQPGGMWLMRPDGYVACVVQRNDAEVIASYLQDHSLFCPGNISGGAGRDRRGRP